MCVKFVVTVNHLLTCEITIVSLYEDLAAILANATISGTLFSPSRSVFGYDGNRKGKTHAGMKYLWLGSINLKASAQAEPKAGHQNEPLQSRPSRAQSEVPTESIISNLFGW